VSYAVPTPAELSLVEASHAISRGELSPVELTGDCLARAREVEPLVKAFVTLDPDGAIAQARTRAEEVAAGKVRGPLHGIPLGIKDLIEVAGLPNTAGSRFLSDNIPGADAPVVGRLREAGAIVLGKTNTHEFAYGVVSAPTCNPWNLGHIPGGSSGGSAAAVAAGICPGAMGTDTAGSIRIPSGLCGVSGLKPRPGVIPVGGIIPLAPSLDCCGPIARDAADLSLMWSALTGGAPAHAADPGALRVAAPRAFHDIGELDPEVESAVDEFMATLTGAGATRVDADLPHLKEWDRPRGLPLMVEALIVHQEAGWYPEHVADYDPATVDAFRYAENLPPERLADAYKALEGLTARLLNVFTSADVLVLPVTPVAAPTHEQAAIHDGEHRPPVTRELTRVCGPVNWCRLAAAAVPCGFTSAGLPVGAQIIGPDERTVLATALLYQSLTDFHTRRPSVTPPIARNRLRLRG
jgi:aspartyl-tRNA(Asn)/glutamyl-tRNA(Gln) amidotransferase subunit A